MRYFLLVVFLLLSLTCGAAIYMQKDAKGNITYSDMPSTNATRVDLPPTPVTNFAPASGAAAAGKNKNANGSSTTPALGNGDQHIDYTAFFISSPAEQQTFQNQRDVAVDVSVTPELQKGDTIQIIVDGNKVGSPAASTHFMVNQLPRGTHQVSAVLLDANKTQIKQAPAINFFVHYASLGGQQ